jgi:hypothetical protein
MNAGIYGIRAEAKTIAHYNIELNLSILALAYAKVSQFKNIIEIWTNRCINILK